MIKKGSVALVTGATGMLGTRLIVDLVAENISVKAMYRSEKRIAQFEKNCSYYLDNPSEISDKITWVKADILDYVSLLELLHDIDIIYHCAAMVSFHKTDHEKMFRNNIEGTSNLVNAALENGIKKFVHVSSVAALGKEEEGLLINEHTAWMPNKRQSGYGISKFHSEMEVWRGINEGFEAIVVNPSVILGPGEWKTGSASFYQNIYSGLKFYTEGVTGFVDVRDVSKAIVMLSINENWNKAKSKRFLLNADNLSYKDLFGQIAEVLKIKPPGIKANRLMLSSGWRLALILGKITGRKPAITKETNYSARSYNKFDGSFITTQFDFQYRPIEKTIKEIGEMFVSSIK